MYTLEENYQDALDKIEELQDRIDKAIEYLKERLVNKLEIKDKDFDDLLDILRGEDNE